MRLLFEFASDSVFVKLDQNDCSYWDSNVVYGRVEAASSSEEIGHRGRRWPEVMAWDNRLGDRVHLEITEDHNKYCGTNIKGDLDNIFKSTQQSKVWKHNTKKAQTSEVAFPVEYIAKLKTGSFGWKYKIGKWGHLTELTWSWWEFVRRPRNGIHYSRESSSDI